MNTAILPRALLPVLVLAAVALFLLNGAVNGGRYDQQLLAMAGVWALVVLGYQFSFGHAGALNLAQGAFFGVGAYTSAILARSYGLDFAVTLPAAVALSAALGVAVALPVLRLKSHYFALATLAVAQLAYLGAVNWQGLTGGANGLPGVPGLRVFGFGLSGAGQLVLVWGLVAAAALFAARLTRGRLGLAFTVSRETPLAAGTIGISVGRLRLAALGLGAAYAGAAGALQVHILRVVSPEVLHFSVLVTCLTMTVIGGRVSVAGGIAAALLLTHLPEWFRGFESYYLVANGGVLLAVVLFAPAGLMGLLEIFAKPWPTPTPTPRPAKVVSRETDSQPVFRDAVLLDMEPLTKSYGGVRALDGAGIAVARGEILGLIGPNGSGKTTLANLVTGLDRADAGRIWISGAEITRWPAHRIARAHVARSFQTPDLPARLTVLDAVAAGADAALARARAMAAMTLDKVGYDGDRTTFCGDLPHGLRRLVELARALVTGPEVIILDEPAAGLSPREADALAGVLTGLAKEGRGLVIIDHNIDFLLPVCHRLVCLDRGRVIADGDPREVAREARVAAAYFGEAV